MLAMLAYGFTSKSFGNEKYSHFNETRVFYHKHNKLSIGRSSWISTKLVYCIISILSLIRLSLINLK